MHTPRLSPPAASSHRAEALEATRYYSNPVSMEPRSPWSTERSLQVRRCLVPPRSNNCLIEVILSTFSVVFRYRLLFNKGHPFNSVSTPAADARYSSSSLQLQSQRQQLYTYGKQMPIESKYPVASNLNEQHTRQNLGRALDFQPRCSQQRRRPPRRQHRHHRRPGHASGPQQTFLFARA
jgi:hypothetical protein